MVGDKTPSASSVTIEKKPVKEKRPQVEISGKNNEKKEGKFSVNDMGKRWGGGEYVGIREWLDVNLPRRLCSVCRTVNGHASISLSVCVCSQVRRNL
jgi:hypothetical protein